MGRSRSIDLRANAKINLFLRVGPPRLDGFHPIRTLFQSIALADRVRIRFDPARPLGVRIRISGARVPAGRQNTVARAWEFLQEEFPEARSGEFAVRIDKRIPVGAGLGGGSADAAAFLVGASRLLGVRLPQSPAFLSKVARRVGADVPFCLTGGTAIGLGLGEILTMLRPLPARRVCVVKPRTAILTSEAYRSLDRFRAARKNLTNRASAHTLSLVAAAVRRRRRVEAILNDFQEPVCRLHPDLACLAGRLSSEGVSAMSGSGSAFFVLPDRRGAVWRLRREFPGVRIWETRFEAKGVRVWRSRKSGSKKSQENPTRTRGRSFLRGRRSPSTARSSSTT